jgi:hypothetical protein
MAIPGRAAAFLAAAMAFTLASHAGRLPVHDGAVGEYVTPWPLLVEPAARQFHCVAAERAGIRGSIAAWTSRRLELIAVASGEPSGSLPHSIAPILKSSLGRSGDAIRATVSGILLSRATGGRTTWRAAGVRWTCKPDHDD